MPLTYDNYPPTADDVRYDPAFVGGVNGSHGDEAVDDVVMFTVGSEDAFRLANDIVRDEDGMVDLGEVRRGLTRAASGLIEAARTPYERGVESFIASALARAKR